MLNYYKVGGSLRFDHPSYVIRQADQDLYNYLKSGQYCFVLNSRQMGKSSLRVRVTRKLRNEGYFCAFLDLTLIGVTVNQEQWYKSLCRQLLDSLELDEINLNLFWQEFEGLSELQRFQKLIEFVLETIDNKLVIFIDEIDSLIRLTFKDDFLGLIRGFYNLRVEKEDYNRLNFCLLGVASPTDLIQDKKRTPFNIGQSINLSGITFTEAKESLLPGLLKFRQPETLLKDILNWTGGQPFLTQKVCYLVTEQSENSEANIKEIIEEYIIKNWASQDQPEHLRTICDRLLINEQEAIGLLTLYSQILTAPIIADETSEQIALRLTGIAVKQNNYLQVYNPIYQQVFTQKWTQEKLNKLRPYYQEINQWIESHYAPNYLLQGETLNSALLWSKYKNLSKIDYQFLSASQREQDRKKNQILTSANQKAKQLIKRGGIFLGVTSFVSIMIAIITTIYSQNKLNIGKEGIRLEKEGIDAITKFNEQQLDSLVSAMKAGQDLKKLVNSQSSLQDYPTLRPISALLKIINQIQELNQLQGHTKGVKTVAFSPDGNLIITGSNDGTVKLWQSNGNLVKTFNPSQNNSPINEVKFSPDGQFMAAGNMEGILTLWTKEGKLIKSDDHGEPIYALNFSPDGKTIVTTGRHGMIKFWNLRGNFLKSFNHTSSIYALIFTENGQNIITGDNQGIITFWTLEGNQIKTIPAHQNTINNLTLSSDGQLLASASVDKTVKLWTKNGQLSKKLTGHKQSVHQVLFTDDNQTIITGSIDKTIKLWSVNGQLLKTLIGHTQPVYDISFNPVKNLLASGSEDRTIKLWKLTENSANLMKQGEEIIKLGVNEDGRKIVAVSLNGLVNIWDFKTQQSQQWTDQKTLVSSLDFNLNKRILVLGKANGLMTLINAENTPNYLKAYQQEITSIRISSDGNLIISADETGIIQLWSKEGNLLKTIDSGQKQINHLEFHPKKNIFMSANQAGIVKLWDTKGNLINTFNYQQYKNLQTIQFSPDGKNFVIGNNQGLITVWNQEKLIQKFNTDEIDAIKTMTIRPNGKMLAIAGTNGIIELWEIGKNPNLLFTIDQSKYLITHLKFTPDNQFLISGDSYGNIRVWSLNLDYLLKQGCQWIRDYWITNDSLQTTLPTCKLDTPTVKR